MSGDPAPPFLDTNVLVYAFSDSSKKTIADELLKQPFSLSVQALNEFVYVLQRKMRFDLEHIASVVDDIKLAAQIIHPVTLETHQQAITLLNRYHFQFYDALMVACALQAGSSVLYSEDMQHYLLINDHLTIVNPFLS